MREQERIVVQPNCSLSWRGAVLVFTAFLLVTMGIALGFASMGLWMVLPFAGLEMLVLAVVLWRVQCAQRVIEVIKFSEDRVSVERGQKGRETHVSLPRAWLRVSLQEEDRQHSQLLLCSGRQRVEVGACLTDEERSSLATELKRRLSWLDGSFRPAMPCA